MNETVLLRPAKLVDGVVVDYQHLNLALYLRVKDVLTG
jgi:hypothetical protein